MAAEKTESSSMVQTRMAREKLRLLSKEDEQSEHIQEKGQRKATQEQIEQDVLEEERPTKRRSAGDSLMQSFSSSDGCTLDHHCSLGPIKRKKIIAGVCAVMLEIKDVQVVDF